MRLYLRMHLRLHLSCTFIALVGALIIAQVHKIIFVTVELMLPLKVHFIVDSMLHLKAHIKRFRFKESLKMHKKVTKRI